MNALFKKEIRYFFTSAIGYVVIGAFMLFSSLFLWVLSGEYNIFQTGFASLQPFFLLSAWIFVFLIPALTMRIISEEKRSGMLPLLFTYPISVWRIILAKYLSVLTILLILLAFSGIYVYIVWQVGAPKGNIDMASTIGSYIALFLLGATFVAVGMFASAMSQNQIIAFVIATFLNFFLFFGLDELVGLFTSNSLFSFGFKVHFEDISRGVIDTRNIVYFSCFTFFFLYLTELSLQTEKK
jgi:gliding motility protein gldF